MRTTRKDQLDCQIPPPKHPGGKNDYSVGENPEPGYAFSFVRIIYLLLEDTCLPSPGTLISSREDLGHLDDGGKQAPMCTLGDQTGHLTASESNNNYYMGSWPWPS